MKPITATLLGCVLAAGLAFAAPSTNPEDITSRVLAAETEAALVATWKDWHPDAKVTVTLKIGNGYPDESFSFSLTNLSEMPNWQEDPELAEALEGYEETTKSTPEISLEETETGPIVTAVTRVDYTWQGYSGQMVQTDRFTFTTKAGRPVIQELQSTYDYR